MSLLKVASLLDINFLIKFIVYYFLFMVSLNILRSKLFNKKSIMIVLGSGGHTSELLIMLKKLDLNKFSEIFFVSSLNDSRSESKVHEVFKNLNNLNNLKFFKIFRSRNVGQSFVSSIFTTILAMLHSIYLILVSRPSMIITNGPGVALPLVYIGYIMKKLKILTEFKILFIESFCRTRSVSLAGKLIQPVADKFIVLWPEIANQNREFLGKII
jgi:beta-1,4-N-acetylglucosaminyltransferase